jgi:LmbE family N-acetylglucosaminyl deacetylase
LRGDPSPFRGDAVEASEREVVPEGASEAAVVVAHPDDETLWAGGTILLHPECRWWIFTLCRASDPDRAPRFRRALEALGAEGRMADLNDGQEQTPLEPGAVEGAVLGLVGERRFDVVFTHGPGGEYTRHRRHEELSRAVASLWGSGRLGARALRLFAYTDEGGRHLPLPDEAAHVRLRLPEEVWREKWRIITGLYGFAADSFEARTTPGTEAFFAFDSPEELHDWRSERSRTR